MKPLRTRRSRPFTITLAAAGVGALMGVQPALGAADPGPVASGILAIASDFSSSAQLSENGDGTATTFVSAMISPNLLLNVGHFDNDSYSISVDLLPGQGGAGSGSGTGQFVMQGVFALDFNTFQYVGPYDVVVEIAVPETADSFAYVHQGLTTSTDPFTGETHLYRRHVVGNQATGNAGAFSIYVDFMDGNGFVLTNEATGGFGLVRADNIHTRDIIK